MTNRDRASHRIDDTWKFYQHAVAGGLDEATLVLGDFRIEEFATQCSEAFEGAVLVGADQPRIARHIDREERGKAAG
jgi:hypothetical protein